MMIDLILFELMAKDPIFVLFVQFWFSRAHEIIPRSSEVIGRVHLLLRIVVALSTWDFECL